MFNNNVMHTELTDHEFHEVRTRLGEGTFSSLFKICGTDLRKIFKHHDIMFYHLILYSLILYLIIIENI